MRLLALALLAVAQAHEDPLVDPLSRQLFDFKEETKKPIGLLSTSAGKPVDLREINTFNSDLLTNPFFIDVINHVVNERIPDREVFAKATGAHGYFEVTHDVTKYTKAKLFEKVGKKTRVLARVGTSQIDKGGSDTTRVAVRGISFKFYTEQGNLDFLNIQIPVYVYRDPILFAEAVHAFRPNPKTLTRDFTAAVNFVTLNPTALHAFLWLVSEMGLPKGFRHMNVFPIHVYELYNKHGETFYVRFKFLAELGYEPLSLEQADKLSGSDPNFFIRDLYNAIEMKHYPAWRLEMDVLNKDLKDLNFNPFDVTRIWPNGTYHTVPIGRIVLNRNVENQFAEVEQAAFNPANLVPGILNPPDMLFKGRVFAYQNAHTHRLGVNHNKIEANCPLHYAKTYNRDGKPPVLDNMRDAPNYYPNSFNGPIATVDEAKPTSRVIPYESQSVYLEDSRRFYNYVLHEDSQKQRLIDNLVELSLRIKTPVVEQFVELLLKVDKELAKRYLVSLEIAKKTRELPATVEDLREDEDDMMARRREEERRAVERILKEKEMKERRVDERRKVVYKHED
ncbi:catalase-2 [Plutella xylostella]|uniref:catalase-2 n=1 Tax=Plutella xylostella TaxID=51655 RepID=UPI00203245ED|nr:catalase-2 [Plutella xylostella]